MISSHDRIRELAESHAAARATEHNRKEAEAKVLARAHLPLWTKAIERAMRSAEPTGHPSAFFHYREVPGWFFSSGGLRWEETVDGPAIDLDELFKLPIHIYTAELTLLLGKPFRVSHDTCEHERSEYDSSDQRYRYWTETSRYFCCQWGGP